MVKINYRELHFDHLVIFEKDNTIFAAARENGNGHMRIFLLFEAGRGRVYTRNGKVESWEEVAGQDAENIRSRVTESRGNQIPVYHINGEHTN